MLDEAKLNLYINEIIKKLIKGCKGTCKLSKKKCDRKDIIELILRDTLIH